MGGKLFSAQRIPQKEYQSLSKHCQEMLASVGLKTLLPESFKSKIEHGDLDVIVCGAVIAKSQLQELFGLREERISQNTSVISIHWEGKYQVDFCFHPEEDFQSAANYQKGGDLGMLLGRIWHKLGFKYGHRGLVYPVKLSDCETLGEISISRDMKTIISFLGLDYQKWLEGFFDEAEIYAWIAESKFFNKDFYQLADLNSINRIRSVKRPSFMRFLEWCEGQTFSNKFIPGRNKAEYLWQTLMYFEREDMLGAVAALITQAGRKKKANEIFNGATIMELTKLQGAELGAILAKFKSAAAADDEDWNALRIRGGKLGMKKIFMRWLNRERQPGVPGAD